MTPKSLILPLLLASLATASLAATPALAWRASNKLPVAGNAAEFRVDFGAGDWMEDYWCAAAEFTISQLGQTPGARIWRTTSVDPRRLGYVGFSLSPERSVGDTGMSTIGRNDGSFSAATAQSFCRSQWTYPSDR